MLTDGIDAGWTYALSPTRRYPPQPHTATLPRAALALMRRQWRETHSNDGNGNLQQV